MAFMHLVDVEARICVMNKVCLKVIDHVSL